MGIHVKANQLTASQSKSTWSSTLWILITKGWCIFLHVAASLIRVPIYDSFETPPGWKRHAHPEGCLYFYNETKVSN